VETRPWHAAFLDALESSGNVTISARRAGVSRTAAYKARRGEAEFRAGWDEALEVALDDMEAEARRRGVEGWTEPVFYQGKVCGHIRKYSDALIMFLLKAYRPEFRDNYRVEHSGDTTIRVEYPPAWPDEPRAVDHGSTVDGLETFRSLGYVPALPSASVVTSDPSALAGDAS
jgi:hypothetical protein